MAPKRKYNYTKASQSQIFQNQSELFEGRRYFKDPKKISEHLVCPICQDVFDLPWVLGCGHTFCKSCIEEWLKNSKICPIDKQPICIKNAVKNFSIANIIGDLTIACSWFPYGCTKIDQYYIVKDHMEVCKFNPNKMDAFMQAEMRKIIPMSPCSSPIGLPSKPTAAKPQVSALDELMAQLDEGALDDSLVEDNFTLPETEMPSLRCRLYMNNQENTRDIMVKLLDDKPNGTKVPKRLKKTAMAGNNDE